MLSALTRDPIVRWMMVSLMLVACGGRASSDLPGSVARGGTSTNSATGGKSGVGGQPTAGGDTSSSELTDAGTTSSGGTASTGDSQMSAVVQVALGNYHSCALLDDGTAKCWGNNTCGQLGGGTSPAPSTPVVVQGLTNAVELSLGADHSCARLGDGTVACWGCNYSNQLGQPGYEPKALPTLVPSLGRVVGIAMGGSHSCARLDDDTVFCWGFGSPTPTLAPALLQPTELALGQEQFAALLADTTVTRWGTAPNPQGLRGTQCAVGCSASPVSVTGLNGITQIAFGDYHLCARTREGTLLCLGDNSNCQLGNYSLVPSATPVAVLDAAGVDGLRGVAEVAAGMQYTCARLDDGTVACWGRAAHGQLGDGTDNDFNNCSPTPVVGVTDAVDIAGGGRHVCALRSSGTVACWGSNDSGELGDGTTERRVVPVVVKGLP